MKKKLLAILSVAGLLTSCGESPSSSSSQRSSDTSSPITSETTVPSPEEDAKIREVHGLYLASGGTLPYEEWLMTVKGEPGSSLLTGIVAPSGNLGNDGDSYIDTASWDFYVKSDGVWAKRGNIHGEKGADGQNGKDGKSAYEIYIEAHPEYTDDEQQWLDDLVNGRLGNQENKTHTVTFDLGYDALTFTQTVEEGKKAVKPETPKRNGYNFLDWVDENKEHWVFNGFSITSDITLYAVWSDPIEYQVSFVNNGGTVLETLTGHYGDAVTYQGATPTAENQDPHYVFTFSGWDKELVITGDTTFTATYTTAYVATTAYYYGEDGTTLLASVKLAEGEKPHFDGETPTKENDPKESFEYCFGGWKKVEETADTIKFVAQFSRYTPGIQIRRNKVVGYTGKSDHLYIPSYWNGVAITKIDISDEEQKNSIFELTLPDSFTEVSDRSLNGFSNLSTVHLPSSVIRIGDGAFGNCSSLKSFEVPSSVKEIGSFAFGQSGLKSLTLNEGLESIGETAFYALSIDKLALPASLKAIDDHALAHCNIGDLSVAEGSAYFTVSEGALYDLGKTKLYYVRPSFGQSFTLPKTLATFVDRVFARAYLSAILVEEDNPNFSSWDGFLYNKEKTELLVCPTLMDYELIEVPEGTKSIASESFREVMTQEIRLPDSVTAICDYAFMDVSASTITLGNGLKSLGKQAFSWLSSLKSLTLPQGLETIGDYAFSGCSSLNSLVIPDSVVSIGKSIISSCSSLTDLQLPSTLKTLPAEIIGGGAIADLVLPDGLETVSHGAFQWQNSLKTLYLPASVTFFCGEGLVGNDSPLEAIFYHGTAEDFAKVEIDNHGSTPWLRFVHYYSETEVQDGRKHWHYVDGKPTAW